MKWIRIFLLISTLTSCSKAEWQSKKTEQTQYQQTGFQLFGGSQEDIAHAVIATQDGALQYWEIPRVLTGILRINPMKFLT